MTDSPGNRFNVGKPVLSMLLEADAALVGAARVMEFGRAKYDRANWLKGLRYTEVMDSLLRHALAVMAGQDVDQESGQLHADHIVCNSLFLSQMMHTRQDMDDRARKEIKDAHDQ